MILKRDLDKERQLKYINPDNRINTCMHLSLYKDPYVKNQIRQDN